MNRRKMRAAARSIYKKKLAGRTDEYRECLLQEHTFKIHARTLAPDAAARLCGIVCVTLGLPKVNRIVLSSSDVAAGNAAHYSRPRGGGEIHFATDYIRTAVLIHEMAHHVQRYGGFHGPAHGVGFLEAQRLVYDVYLTVASE